MSDILYDAAIEYQKLKNVIYKILIGRKNQSYDLRLHFPPESFFHLAGLQHLVDITFPSKNKEKMNVKVALFLPNTIMIIQLALLKLLHY